MGRASPGRGNSVRASYLSVVEVMKLRMRRGVRNARFCIDMPDIFATVEEVHISTPVLPCLVTKLWCANKMLSHRAGSETSRWDKWGGVGRVYRIESIVESIVDKVRIEKEREREREKIMMHAI